MRILDKILVITFVVIMTDVLSMLTTTLYEGAFIAKVKYQCFQSELNEETYRNDVVKSNKKLCIAKCSGYIENEIAETLTIYLMINVSVKKPI